MATYDNAQPVMLCGPRDPYPGESGITLYKEGALADLIPVDGNTLEAIDLVADSDNNFILVMNDGVIYKNMLH